MKPGSAPLEGCLEALRRCDDVVAILRSPRSSAAGFYAVVGPHLRHCVDHFDCFLRGVADGVVDYDARDRDVDLERDPEAFLAAVRRIRSALLEVGSAPRGRGLRVLQAAAPGHEPIAIDTTLERELLFLSSHTIHHLAIVAMIARPRGVEIPEPLFTAFSTAAYQDRWVPERA